MEQYALIENGQIVFTENFKRPELVPPDADWRVVGEVLPEFDAATHHLGSKTLQVFEDGTVAYVWSVVERPPASEPEVSPVQLQQVRAVISAIAKAANLDDVTVANLFIEGAKSN
jgi:hypothetical protein